MHAVKAFAADEPSLAGYHPEDERCLVERSPTVDHYQRH
jgi:hypothetical protein